MSFLSVSQKELRKILAVCSQISPRVSDVEIFTYTQVSVQADKVQISCFNSSTFFQSVIVPVQVDHLSDPIEFLIKTDLFASTVSLITDENLGLNLDLNKLVLVVQGSTSKHTLRIKIDGLDDFVRPNRQLDKVQATLLVDSNEFLKANKVSQVSVGNPRTVYQQEFLHICFTLKPALNQLLIVSTDRHRMVQSTLTPKYATVAEALQTSSKNYLINPKSLSIVAGLVDTDSELEFSFQEDVLWVKLNQTELAIKYGEGTYPDYEKILPQSFACSFLINTKELLEALRQVFYLARLNTVNKSVTVQVEPAQNQLKLVTTTSDGYASESVVNMLTYEGSPESWSQSFNAEYLIDYIATVDTEKLLWEANPGKPTLLSPENQKSKQIYLVSGLR